MKPSASVNIALKVTLLALVTVLSCRIPDAPVNPDGEMYPPGVPNVAVNPEYEMNPPLAREVQIQKLNTNNGGNLLVVADFGQGTIKGPFHAIELSTGKIVMRDDGKGVDGFANDGKFSVVIQEDMKALGDKLEWLQKNKENLIQELPTDFKGRHVVKRDFSSLIKYNWDGFLAGDLITIPQGVLCRLQSAVSIPHSLLVTNLGSVESSSFTVQPCTGAGAIDGAWTFKKLISDIANTPVTGVSAEDFVKDWLETWLHDIAVNSDLVERRAGLYNVFISPWIISSGSPAGSFDITNWRTRPLNLDRAPFKLTAIVNRLDLRGNMGYGVSNTGEGRFIFGVLNPNTCEPIRQEFNVIFEYGIPIHSCAELKAYGQRWHNLKTLSLGSTAYNNALKEITDVFAAANADPSRPNGSAINQIRTNEAGLGRPWELREFNISPTTHKLFLTTVKQEPSERYKNTFPLNPSAEDVANLTTWITNNESQILIDKHRVPLTIFDLSTFSLVPFLGGVAHVREITIPTHWTVPGIANETRHHFALNTCSGCHKQETQTSFVHLSTVPFGTESTPSRFLTGIDAPDPEDPTVTHSFNDLLLRQRKLEDLLCEECTQGLMELLSHITFDPTAMMH